MRRSAAGALALALFTVAFPSAPLRASAIVSRAVAPQTITTLLFHQVSDEPIRSAHGEDNGKEPWLTPAQFDALLGTLEARGYTVVSLDASLAALGVRTNGGAGSAERVPVGLSPAFCVFGLLAGVVAFAALTSVAAYRVARDFTFHYFAGF